MAAIALTCIPSSCTTDRGPHYGDDINLVMDGYVTEDGRGFELQNGKWVQVPR